MAERYGWEAGEERPDPAGGPPTGDIDQAPRTRPRRDQAQEERRRSVGIPLKDEDGKFSISLNDRRLTIEDDQAAPVERVRIGQLGTGAEDYGIEVYSSAGDKVLDVQGTVATVAGWTMDANTLSSGEVTLDALNEQLRFGSGVTGPLTGVGIFVGLDGVDYELRAGDPAGDLVHWDGSSLTVVGAITATTITADSGTIGGFTITSTSIESNNLIFQSDTERILLGAATAPLTGVGIFAGKDVADYELRAGDPSGQFVHWDGSVLTIRGAVIESPGSGTDPALLGWTHDLVFTASDNTTVAWGTGTIELQNGVTYSIVAGNTGVMAATTYIYLDSAVSITALQTTTTRTNAVGANRILVAVAENVADSSKDAEFIVFGGGGSVGSSKLFVQENIAADAITFNEIAGNTIVGANIDTLNISGKTATFDAGTVGGWTMAAGSLSSGSVTLDASAEQFRFGAATGFDPATGGTGIIMGLDAGTDYDFRVGDSADYIWWDASAASLTVGGTIISDTFTATAITVEGSLTVESNQAGQRVVLEDSAGDAVIRLYDAAGVESLKLEGSPQVIASVGSGVFTVRTDLGNDTNDLQLLAANDVTVGSGRGTSGIGKITLDAEDDIVLDSASGIIDVSSANVTFGATTPSINAVGGQLHFDHDSDTGNTRQIWRIEKDGGLTWILEHDYNNEHLVLDGSGASGEFIISDGATGNPGVFFRQGGTTRAFVRYLDTGDDLVIDSDFDIHIRPGNTLVTTYTSAGDIHLANTTRLYFDGGTDAYIRHSTDLQLFHSNIVNIACNNGDVEVPNVGSTSGGDTARIDTSGSILRFSSSARWKEWTRDLGVQEALKIVMEIGQSAHWYKSLTGKDDQRKRFLGFTAEQVASVEPKLTTYDDEGKPRGILFEGVYAAGLRVVADHETRIVVVEDEVTRLRSENEALKQRVAALEAAA